MSIPQGISTFTLITKAKTFTPTSRLTKTKQKGCQSEFTKTE